MVPVIRPNYFPMPQSLAILVPPRAINIIVTQPDDASISQITRYAPGIPNAAVCRRAAAGERGGGSRGGA